MDIGLAADLGTLTRVPRITGNDSLLRELCYTGACLGWDGWDGMNDDRWIVPNFTHPFRSPFTHTPVCCISSLSSFPNTPPPDTHT